MESHEVLKEAINHVGAKSVAADMNLSTSLIYKWCQPTNTPDASGADNPLDRLVRLYECTGDTRIISWLCHEADGFFVNNPRAKKTGTIDKTIFDSTQKILKEFSDLLEVVSHSYSNDKQIDSDEAKKIRTAWDNLKSVTENFVVSCESGCFSKSDP